MLDRQYYKFVDMILWDIHSRYIEEHILFYYIEKRWSYIDITLLEQKDHVLISRLINEYGNGMFLINGEYKIWECTQSLKQK